MKKMLFISLAFVFGIFVMTSSATASVVDSPELAIVDQEASKTPVEIENLPAPVKEALQGTDYEGWVVTEAALISKDGEAYYAVKLVKGNESKKLKFTADGEAIE